MLANRIDEGREFVASDDIWFRPAQFANAPDGTLYIVDVYREVIEHPVSLPPEIKQHLDLTSGRDRGRIYRVVPDGFVQPPLPRLAKRARPRTWSARWSIVAAGAATPRRDCCSSGTIRRQSPALESLVRNSKLPEARMHALVRPGGLELLTAPVALVGLDDPDPRVRQHAVRLAERLTDGTEIAAKLNSMTDDGDVRVRYQLAFSLGEFAGADRDAALARLIRRDGADPLMRTAIFSSLFRGAGNVLAALLGDDAARGSTPLRPGSRAIGHADRPARQVPPNWPLARTSSDSAARQRSGRDHRGSRIGGRPVQSSAGTRQNAVPCRARGRGSGPIARRGEQAGPQRVEPVAAAASSRSRGRWAWARMRRRRKR